MDYRGYRVIGQSIIPGKCLECYFKVVRLSVQTMTAWPWFYGEQFFSLKVSYFC